MTFIEPVQGVFVLLMICVALGFLGLAGAFIYDIKQIKNKREEQKHPYSKKYLRRPLVSVVIQAGGDVNQTQKCLLSILRGSYRKYEVVLVTNQKSPKGLSELITKYPKKNIKILSLTDDNKLQEFIKKNIKGEIEVEVEDSCYLSKDAIKNLVKHLAVNDEATQTTANIKIIPDYTIAGTIKEPIYLIKNYWRKFKAVSRLENMTGEVIAYRNNVKNEVKENQTKTSYANDAIAFLSKPSAPMFRHYKPKNIWRLSAILVPLTLTYFVYLAVFEQYTTLLSISWAATSLVLIFVTIADEYMVPVDKARLILMSPLLTALLYIASLNKYLIFVFNYLLYLLKMIFSLGFSKSSRKHIRMKSVGKLS